MSEHLGFMRLPQVLDMIPISKSGFWKGVAEGRFPKPIKLQQRTTVWRRSDIIDFCEKVDEENIIK